MFSGVLKDCGGGISKHVPHRDRGARPGSPGSGVRDSGPGKPGGPNFCGEVGEGLARPVGSVVGQTETVPTFFYYSRLDSVLDRIWSGIKDKMKIISVRL